MNDLFEKCRGDLSIPLFSSLGEADVKGNGSNDAVCGKPEKNVWKRSCWTNGVQETCKSEF